MKTKKESKQKGYANKEKAYHVAEYYGFEGIETWTTDKQDESSAKTLLKQHTSSTHAEVFLPEVISLAGLLRHYSLGTLPLAENQPALIYHETAGIKRGGKKVNLHIVGSNKSITEATLMKAGIAILREYGHKNLSIEINSFGDKDSLSRFQREIGVYFKKHLSTLLASERSLLAKDPFLFLETIKDKHVALVEGLPPVVSFLNDSTRAHFKEVLEFLECMNIPYRITNTLIGNRVYSNNTVFSIVDNADTKDRDVLAYGTRYNGFSKKTGNKRDVPGAVISISLKKPLQTKAGSKAFSKARFYFIQLGFEAKLKSLEIIDMLREAKIPVCQSLSKDKLGAQLTSAEAQNFPYLLIVGQKEALDKTVLVRYKETRSQEAVPVSKLVEYLKKLP